jgi:hypothetical protein
MMNARNRLHTDNTLRFCSRCGDAVTDPASRECGVGPVCRRKDTHLYAKTISANFGIATIRAMSVREDMLAPEVQDTWKAALKRLLKAAEKVANLTDDMTIMRRTGADLREVVRACDLVCSYENPGREVRNAVIDVVHACGYIGLAAVLAGQASTSPSRVWFENGRVFMAGLGNKSGWAAMRQIPGIVTPRHRGDRSPYSAPAAQATTFLANVRRYWPMYEGDLAALATEAESWIAANPQVAVRTAVSTAPVHTFVATTRTQDFTVQFPWVRDANMAGFMTQLKTIPANQRSYDATTRTWSFTLENLDRVLDIARNSNIFAEIRKVDSETATPVGMYGQRTVARRTYRQQNTWHSARYYGGGRL